MYCMREACNAKSKQAGNRFLGRTLQHCKWSRLTVIHMLQLRVMVLGTAWLAYGGCLDSA